MTEHSAQSLSRWDQRCFYVRDEMAKYVSRVVTPVSRSDSPDHGTAHATGNYLTLRGLPYLQTNEHVIREALGSDLGHLPGPTDDYVLCNNEWLALTWPTDIAVMRLSAPPFDKGSPTILRTFTEISRVVPETVVRNTSAGITLTREGSNPSPSLTSDGPLPNHGPLPCGIKRGLVVR
jgi:hypothetical protein